MSLALLLLLLAPAAAPAAANAPAPTDEWTHWHWVYQGIAHAQPFVANGTEVKSLMVRAARLLPERAPSSPLLVEVRDPSLEKVLLRGTVSPKEAGKSFRWTQVSLPAKAEKLEKGKPYVLVFRSPDTLNEAPWILAEKEPVWSKDQRPDLSKRQFASVVLFRDGAEVRVGPAAGVPDSTPWGARTSGGQPFGQSTVVELDKPLPPQKR